MPSCSRLFSAALLLAFLAGCTTPTVMNGWFSKQEPRKEATVKSAPTPQKAVISEAKPTPQQQLAQQPSNAITSAPVNDKTKVAILLPLSGKNAALGQSLLNAAQMAVFDLGSDKFELMPRDTGTTPQSAAQAAQDALGSGAQLLIGPLFAADVTAVKPVAREHNVSVLALSSDASLAEQDVYVMGFSPASLVERVIDYASQQGYSNFAGIFPQTPYGKLVQEAFAKSVHEHHALLTDEETYASTNDIPKAVGNVFALKDRIDAVFIPAGGPDLQAIATAIAAQGLSNNRIRFLGTGLWDDPATNKIQTLQGGWFAMADPQARETFKKNYKETYHQEPQRLATLAYDATALAALLAKRNQGYNRVTLTTPNGFAGLDGIFRLTKDGLTERGLAIGEITPNGIVARESAPTAFEP